jgi:alpha-1,6-mannosyltransferase
VYFRFAMVWSFLIFMTYAGYSKNDFQEIIWITALQYIIVLGYLAYELYRHEKRIADHILPQS